MKLNKQVCSLDLAKRLKELGVKQGSAFYWMETQSEKPYLYLRQEEPKNTIGCEYASAFTVAELGEMLPKFLTNHHEIETMYKFQKGTIVHIRCAFGGGRKPEFLVSYYGETGYDDQVGKDIYWKGTQAPTEADARALMVAYLIENGIMKPNELVAKQSNTHSGGGGVGEGK